MGEADNPDPVTEPVIAADIFATSVTVEPIDGNVRITGIVGVEGERRIVSRTILPVDSARQLATDLRRVLNKGAN